MKKELPVNYIQHLTGFFEMVAQDNRLSMGHIALYVTLFQFWNLNRFQNPLSIARSEIMLISKIGSKSTYTKLLKELDEFGYIEYLPSHNPIKGSLVNLYTFGHSTGHSTGASSGHSTGATTGQSSGTLVVPSINNIKHINIINKREGEFFSTKKISPPPKVKKNENSSLKPKQVSVVSKIKTFSIPHLDDVQNYFLEKESTNIEAEKFHNYFESNGWLVGGKTKMKDWRAAARNWMLNVKQFAKTETTSSHLHVNENKRYDIPL